MCSRQNDMGSKTVVGLRVAGAFGRVHNIYVVRFAVKLPSAEVFYYYCK